MQGKLATPGAQKVGGLKAYQVSAEVLSSRSREGGRGGFVVFFLQCFECCNEQRI